MSGAFRNDVGLGVWLVASGYLGSRAGTIPDGARRDLFVALYVGYPFWAVRTSRLIDPPDRRPRATSAS